MVTKKNEDLTREELIKQLTLIESSILPGKDRIIQGQNNTIQTLTAQNLMFRDLLKKVLDLKIGFFNKDELTILQKHIQEKLNEWVTKRQASSAEMLTEQNLILRDLVEQLSNIKLGLFDKSAFFNLQKYAKKVLDEFRGR